MRHLALLALWLLSAACLPLPQEAPYPGAPDLFRCGGDSVVALIGQPIGSLPGTGGWGALRVIRPLMAITEDYSETRLNVQLDGADRIIALSCG